MRMAAIAALLGLAACAPTTPDTPALPLVRADVAPEAAATAAGEARIPVRAISRSGSSVAAECTAEGAGFNASFTAPAEVAVPSFGAASAPVTIRCAADGARGARLAQPIARRENGIGGWPAVGVGVSSGGGSYVSLGGFWNGGWGGGPQTYGVSYPAVDVPLE
jgi:hypothetical protein